MSDQQIFEEFGQLIDELDGLAHGLKIPLDDSMHVGSLKRLLPDKVERLKDIYREIAGENPWE